MSAAMKLGKLTTLAKCPVGLFVAMGYPDAPTLCVRTEYNTNEGRIHAYIVESGETFCGTNPQTVENQRQQLVHPVEIDFVKLLAELGVGS